ncbi:MAG: hypothetical protein Roseis2KO_29360 [Roseivirga sp.]
MNRLPVILLCVTLCFKIKAQIFYEIQCKAYLDYTTLVVYYDDSQIEVGVKYTDANNIYRVAKYNCEGSIERDESGFNRSNIKY